MIFTGMTAVRSFLSGSCKSLPAPPSTSTLALSGDFVEVRTPAKTQDSLEQGDGPGPRGPEHAQDHRPATIAPQTIAPQLDTHTRQA